MEVDILIDRITDCLIDTRTGAEVETEYRMRETPIKPKDYKGWKFNWSITEKNGYHIYELFLKGDDTVQEGYLSRLMVELLMWTLLKLLHITTAIQEDMKELAHIYLRLPVR